MLEHYCKCHNRMHVHKRHKSSCESIVYLAEQMLALFPLILCFTLRLQVNCTGSLHPSMHASQHLFVNRKISAKGHAAVTLRPQNHAFCQTMTSCYLDLWSSALETAHLQVQSNLMLDFAQRKWWKSGHAGQALSHFDAPAPLAMNQHLCFSFHSE